MAPRKPRKTISKFRTRVGNYPPPTTSVLRDDKVEVPEAIQESSEQILKDHFPQFEQRIAEVDVLKVYGRKAQD